MLLREDGRSDFGALIQARARKPRSRPSTFCASMGTICACVRSKSGEARSCVGVDGILFSEALAEEDAFVFAKACELGLEGIVSKRSAASIREASTRAEGALEFEPPV